MNIRELLQQALEALQSENPDIQLRAAIALGQALEAEPELPVAWQTFDGEGGYDYRSYDMNENYDKEWAARNPNHKNWVEPLYTAPALVNPKPSRLFSLRVGDTFVLRRNKKVYTLVELQWTPGMGTQYICKNLKTGKTERLHHSVLVDKAGKGV